MHVLDQVVDWVVHDLVDPLDFLVLEGFRRSIRLEADRSSDSLLTPLRLVLLDHFEWIPRWVELLLHSGKFGVRHSGAHSVLQLH